jgi:hypothetical protein
MEQINAKKYGRDTEGEKGSLEDDYCMGHIQLAKAGTFPVTPRAQPGRQNTTDTHSYLADCPQFGGLWREKETDHHEFTSSPLQPTCFTIKNISRLPTQCICVFRMILTINSDYFPKQH